VQKLVCPSNSSIVVVSPKIKIRPYKKYIVTTQVIGNEGSPYSAYFGLAVFNDNDEPIRSNDAWKNGKNDFSIYKEEKIRWLNDFSGIQRKYSIIFSSDNDNTSAQICYRINDGTPIKSANNLTVLPIDKITIMEADSSLEEKYDRPWNFILPRVQELTMQQELQLERNMVWIFGSRRSGTSWLANQLLSFHTLYIHEPNLTSHLAPEGDFGFGQVERLIDYTKRLVWTDYFFSDNYKATWQYYLRKLILYRIYAKSQDFTQKVIIKEPSSGEGASDLISACMPLSKVMILLRDGRDIIDSLLDARQKGGWLADNPGSIIDGERARLIFIEYQAKLWIKQIKLLIKTHEIHSKDYSLVLKYEDLRSDTLGTLRGIYDFLEIEISNEVLKTLVSKYSYENIPEKWKGNGKFIRSASPGKWKVTFTEKEKDLMNNLMGNTLHQLGYS
jgi:hypothetical protein